ncbi:MAG: metal-dependent hydrolase [Cognatishimia sp.]
MLIGHLPSGYIAACTCEKFTSSRTFFVGMVLGAFLPDIDMLWFHFVDHGAVHHHEYITHRPIVWLAVLTIGFILQRKFLLGLGLGGILHMLLDTLAGAIVWGWPLATEPNTLVIVQATHDHWIKSFLWHWTFKVEIVVTLSGLGLFVFRRWKSRSLR